MLKMDYCGMGASGRSVGHLPQTIGKDFPNLIKLYGKNRGVTTACIADRKVDCDLEAFAS